MPHDEPAIGKIITEKWGIDVDEDGATYDPVIVPQGGPVNLGSTGFIRGAQKINGHKVTANVEAVFDGSGIDYGGASWRISLPVKANLDVHNRGFIGSGEIGTMLGAFKIRSAGVPNISGACLLFDLGDGSFHGQAVVLYEDASLISVAGVDFSGATNLQLTLEVVYIADPTLL